MIWKNLKENKCPNCGKDFMLNLSTMPIDKGQLLIHGCGFKIRESRYQQIVAGQIEGDLEAKKIEDSVICDSCGHFISMHSTNDICYTCKSMGKICD